MKNKNLAIVLVALFAISCSHTEKSAKSETTPVVETKNAQDQDMVVHFDFNKYAIRKDAREVLDEKILPEIKAAGNVKIKIEGHCDERGSYEYNMKLGKKRAEAVKSYLVKNGVKAAKIRTVSFGETKPVDFGHNEDAWAKNRRAVTIVVGKK
jgi:peptidoglycan-associated lipoprotein